MNIDIVLAIIISFALNLIYTNLKFNEFIDDFTKDMTELFGEIFEDEEIVNEDNEEE